MSKFYGKYKALVTNINDTEKRGRVKVQCPKVYGDFESPWCLPCVPFASDNGGMFKIPSVNEMVWIEFEEGDPNYPILVGGLWQLNSSPLSNQVYPNNIDGNFILRTKSGHIVHFSEGEFVKIQDSRGSNIVLDSKSGNVTIDSVGDIILNGRRVYKNGSPI